jgi:hypothetical protein
MICRCRMCRERIDAEREQKGEDIFSAVLSHGMIVCATCGNKRCPHATSHNHSCTNSNEPGQVGSVYGIAVEEGKR